MSDEKKPSLLGHEKRIKELEARVEVLEIYLSAALHVQVRSREAQILAADFDVVCGAESAT